MLKLDPEDRDSDAEELREKSILNNSALSDSMVYIHSTKGSLSPGEGLSLNHIHSSTLSDTLKEVSCGFLYPCICYNNCSQKFATQRWSNSDRVKCIIFLIYLSVCLSR